MPLYHDHLISPIPSLIGACGIFQTLLSPFPGRSYALPHSGDDIGTIIFCKDQLSFLVNLPSSFICSAKMYSKYLRGNVVSIKYFQPDGSREVEPFYKLKFPDWYTRGQRTRRDP